MDSFRTKLITILIAFGLVAGGGIGALLYYVLPQFYPNWYLGIVFFFLITESLLIAYVVKSSQTATQKKMVNIYMLAKVVKMILALFFIAIYALTVKENIKSFVVVFIVFYGLYLGIETYMFSKIEKYMKEKNNTQV